MLILGLTGGIATGKSTVSKIFAKQGIPVIDADVLARQVVEPGQSAYDQILAAFKDSTPDLILSDRNLDRPALGRRIFNDDDARKKLNAITHPAVRRAMTIAALKYWLTGHNMVVMDVPLLFEGGLDLFCGTTVVVACSDQLQMERLLARDAHLSKDDAASRVRSQMPISQKSARADIVIQNDESLEALKAQVEQVVKQVTPYRLTGLLEWICPPFGLTMGFWTVFTKFIASKRVLRTGKRTKSKL